jgi:uncharacterized protein (TIGR01777 family)
MKIVVAGSSGVLGTALVAALTERGDEVIRLVRPQSRTKGIAWDPAVGSIAADALEGADGVVNLAGRSIGERRWTAAEKQLVLTSRVESTHLLANTIAGLEQPPKVLINASAIGYYGDGGDRMLAEDAPAGSGFLSDVCVAWEGATVAAESAGVRVAHIRTGIVLSTAGGALGRMLAPLGPRWISPYRWGLGGPIAGGRQWWSWISLQDEIRAILHVIDHEISGPVNLVAPNPVTNRDFTKALGRTLRRPAVMPIPGFVLKLFLGPELAAALVLEGQRVVPQVLLDSGFEFSHPDIDVGLQSALN